MIILDLQSEQFPQYGKLRSYYGQPFIWCMLHNFGGTLGMFGSAKIINQVFYIYIFHKFHICHPYIIQNTIINQTLNPVVHWIKN